MGALGGICERGPVRPGHLANRQGFSQVVQAAAIAVQGHRGHGLASAVIEGDPHRAADAVAHPLQRDAPIGRAEAGDLGSHAGTPGYGVFVGLQH